MSYRNLAIEQTGDGKLVIKDIINPLDLWEATRRYFKERRPVKTGRHFTYPETTNGEVRQLAEVWTKLQRRVLRWDLARARQHADEWKEAISAIETATAGADPDQTFARNEDFWLRWTKRQAVYLSAVREQPSKRDMIIDSIKGAVKKLPDTLATSAEAVADGGASIAKKAGEVASAPVRGLFGGLFGRLGTPLLIGAAVVGGVIVVPKLLARRAPIAPPPSGGGA